MPFNGQGTFAPKHTWVNEANIGTPMLPANFDDQTADIAAGLSNAILRDGTGGPTQDIPWNGFGITGLRAPSLAGDAANKAYVDTATAARSMAGYKLTNVATPTVGTDAANMAYVLQVAMNAALPNQAGSAGKFTTTDGTNSRWDWSQYMNRSARTANTALAQSDRATLIDITSGTFTQTFTAAATLGAGWYCLLRNSGSGDITVDPSGAELIDGLTSYVMYRGEARLIQCDGTGFTSVVVRPFSKTFISSDTFIKPPGYQQLEGLAWSAGQSGARSGSTAASTPGGNGGGCFPFVLPAVAVGATETVTIGAGGAAITGTATQGSAGGATAFGTFFTVTGANGSGGGAISGYLSINGANAIGFEAGSSNGGSGSNSVWGGSAAYSAGTQAAGSSIYGGAAGGSVDASAVVRAAGTSKFGGNGGAASSASNGADGVAPGGGGGATQTGAQSGAGARGEIRIWGKV